MNRREFLIAGSAGVLGLAAFGLEGCPTVAQWIQIALGLIPIALQTVSSLKFGSAGVPPNVLANITEYGKLATTVFQDVEADIHTAETTPGIIPKIDAELTNLEQQSAVIIPQITSNAGVLVWAQSILADAIDIANLVPLVTTVAPATPTSAAVTVYETRVSLASAKSLQQVFKARLAACEGAG